MFCTFQNAPPLQFWSVISGINPLNAISQNGQTYSNNSLAFADELLECV